MRHDSPEEIGARLAHVRAGESQDNHAADLGVPLRTYQTYEQGKREPDLRTLLGVARKGWNLNWLITGDGPQRLEALEVAESRAGYRSQELSEEAVSIALQITDDIIRDGGARYVPRVLYARLFRLMLQGITQGLPVADVFDVGRGAFRGLVSGSNAESGDDGEQAVGGAGQGGRR